MPVVVDCGLTQEAQRCKWGRLVLEAGLRVQLHHLDIDADERWLRVQRRNAERGVTYGLEVTRKMFEFVETLWERPTDAEMARLNGVRVTEK